MSEQLNLGPNEATPFIQTEDYLADQQTAQAYIADQQSLSGASEAFGPTSHYATIKKADSDERDVLRIPEAANSIDAASISEATPEGKIKPVQLPDSNRELQTWFKTGITLDAKGDRHVVLEGALDHQDELVTIPATEYAAALMSQKARNALSDAALGQPKFIRRNVETPIVPSIEPEHHRRIPRSQLVANNPDSEPIDVKQKAHQEIEQLTAGMADDQLRLLADYARKTDEVTMSDQKKDYNSATTQLNARSAIEAKMSPDTLAILDKYMSLWKVKSTLGIY